MNTISKLILCSVFLISSCSHPKIEQDVEKDPIKEQIKKILPVIQVLSIVRKHSLKIFTDNELISAAVMNLQKHTKITPDTFYAGKANNNENVDWIGAAYNLSLYIDKIIQNKNNYSRDELMHIANDSILRTVDRYSRHIKNNKLFASSPRKKVGFDVAFENNKIIATNIFLGSPAYKAGVTEGDEIIEINSALTNNLSTVQISRAIYNSDANKIKLKIKKKNTKKSMLYSLIPKEMHIKNFSTTVLPGNIIYIKFRKFEDKYKKFLQIYLQKYNKINNGAKGIVFDLRGNSGGVLKESLLIADMFLDSGVILKVKSKHLDDSKTYTAKKDSYIGENIPMVVIVDSFTASGGEIVASALQENKRAIILGSKTYGNGTIQTIKKLMNNDYIQLTTGMMYTSNNSTWESKGIEPDVCINYNSKKIINTGNCSKTNGNVSQMNNDFSLRYALKLLSAKLI